MLFGMIILLIVVSGCSLTSRSIKLEWLPAGRVSVDLSDPALPQGSYSDLRYDEDWYAEVGILKSTDDTVEDLDWISLDSGPGELAAPLTRPYLRATHIVAYLWADDSGPSGEPDYYGVTEFDRSAGQMTIRWWLDFDALNEGVTYYAVSRSSAYDLAEHASVDLDFTSQPYYLLTYEDSLRFAIQAEPGAIRAWADSSSGSYRESPDTELDLATTEGSYSWYIFRPVDLNSVSPARFVPYRGAVDVAATVVDAGRVELTWVDMGFQETGFEVQRAPAGSQSFGHVGSVLADETSFADTSTQPSHSYDYRIRAVNLDGDSPWSESVRVTTPRIAFSHAVDVGPGMHSAGSVDLEVDSSDGVHLAFATTNGLAYATYDGTGWTETLLDPDGDWHFISIATDRTNAPHISYGKGWDSNLAYVRWNGSAWVGHDGGAGPDIVDTRQNSNLNAQMVLSDAGVPSFMNYRNTYYGYIFYTEWSGTDWVRETASMVAGSFALDAMGDGTPCFVRNSSTNLDFVTRETDWVATRVDSGLSYGTSFDAVLDESDQMHVLYTKEHGSTVTYAWPTGAGSWTMETVMTGTDIFVARLIHDAAGNPHGAVVDDGSLFYIWHDGVRWHTEFVARIDDGSRLDFDLDSTGRAHLIVGSVDPGVRAFFRYGTATFE